MDKSLQTSDKVTGMTHEQLFASFILDDNQGLEIALKAEHVTEATPVNGSLQKIPGSVDFLEGIMHLRDDLIPVINLKKRLGLPENKYRADAKVAVVSIFEQRYGLLVDDIKEVFRADSAAITPISKPLQTKDRIISALIKLGPGKQAMELLDLNSLFGEDDKDLKFEGNKAQSKPKEVNPPSYSRYVIFTCAGQEYGVPVKYSQEITFYSEINDMFKTGIVEGALELRGKTIPVINSHALLSHHPEIKCDFGENTRVLVLASDGCFFGMIVDEVKEIATIPDNEILAFPAGKDETVTGLYPRSEDKNIIMLNMYNLVCNQLDSIKSMSRIGNGDGDEEADQVIKTTSHHLITENCYLVFSIGKHFAIELKDVQEIIENDTMIDVPGATGYSTSVINLRGQVVPVVNLRSFYNYQTPRDNKTNKLIICKGHGQIVAIEVNRIVTIYKQEQYHETPSLNDQLNDKKDTVDRLIEFTGSEDIKEHVLVVNTGNLIRNHLQSGKTGHSPVEHNDDITPENAMSQNT